MPVGSRASPALISQVGDLIQLVKELYADNQHLKKTIFDLSCVGFPGDNKPESVDQTEVRRSVLTIASPSQRATAPRTYQGCVCSGGSLEIPFAVDGLWRPSSVSMSARRVPQGWVVSGRTHLMFCDARTPGLALGSGLQVTGIWARLGDW